MPARREDSLTEAQRTWAAAGVGLLVAASLTGVYLEFERSSAPEIRVPNWLAPGCP